MKKALLAVSAAGLLSSPVHAAEPRIFKPSGQWVADFGEDYCRLSRPFTEGSDTITIALERIQPVNSVRLIMVGNGLKMYRGSTELGYTLSPSGGERKGPFWKSITGDNQDYLNLGEMLIAQPIAFGPPGSGAGAPPPPPPATDQPFAFPPYDRAAEQEFASGINAIDFTSGLIDPVRFEIGGLKAPIGVLQQCADDLLKVWGLDPVKHQTMTRPAQPSGEASKWLPTGTIGFGDFAKLGGSANQFRVMVSADGKPSACAVHWPSLDKKTNDAVCKAIMDKGTFSPALDAQGQAMDSYWTVAPFMLMLPMGGR